jgi:lambda family phage minor tail protein L
MQRSTASTRRTISTLALMLTGSNAVHHLEWPSISSRYPIEATEFEYTGTGSLPRPKLRISNIYGTITALFLRCQMAWKAPMVTRLRTLARYLACCKL